MSTITVYTVFEEDNKVAEWRNQVAKDLNTLLGRAQYFLETSNDESDQAALEATLRIVQYVATFAEIEVKS